MSRSSCTIITYTVLILKVLSTTVANAFEMEDNQQIKETIRFIRMMDTYFDIMNVRSLNESVFTRKPNLRPFRSSSDDRFKVINTLYHAKLRLSCIFVVVRGLILKVP